MKISIIIPCYNSENLLKKNLPKVLGSVLNEKFEIELILTDDASLDNSLTIAEETLSSAKNTNFSYKILSSNKTFGFSSNVNKGAKEATGEILILLNTDVSPEEGFLDSLIKHFDNKNVFAVGCLDKSIEGEKTIFRGRGIGSFKKGFLIHKKGEVSKTNTLWVSGGSGAFRKDIWEKLGGLDPLFNPFYWEDIDLSYRALKSGYKILFEPKSVVLHEHEKGVIKNKYSQFRIKTTAYRNQFIFFWKNITDRSLILKHILFLPYHFLLAIFNLDIAFFLGFLKAFFLLPKIIKSKLKSKKLFLIKDSQIVAELI